MVLGGTVEQSVHDTPIGTLSYGLKTAQSWFAGAPRNANWLPGGSLARWTT
jgi:hypothetical protein